jgi:hypothetical protein
MQSTDKRSGLRLARMAGDSVLREKVLSARSLDRGLVGTIAVQLRSIIAEMEAEWRSDPASGELGEAFRLLGNYADCLGSIERPQRHRRAIRQKR